MFSIISLLAGVGGPDVALSWILYILSAFMLVVIVTGWLTTDSGRSEHHSTPAVSKEITGRKISRGIRRTRKAR